MNPGHYMLLVGAVCLAILAAAVSGCEAPTLPLHTEKTINPQPCPYGQR